MVNFYVSASERMFGIVEEIGASFQMVRGVDRELASAIEGIAKEQQILMGTINYATSAGPFSFLPLNWGAIVPLRFMPDVPIVVITPPERFIF